MACKDCFNNCGDPTPDECVKYTGPDIELFDICSGEPLSKLNEAIVESLLSALDGTGITVKDVTLNNASWLIPILGAKDKTLVNLIQLLVDTSQTLRNLITSLTPKPSSFSTECLSGLPANATSDQILQATLKNLCSLKTTVEALPTTYVQLSDLTNLVTTIINTGPSGSIPTFNSRMVPFIAYPYHGPLSNFNNGVGLSSAGFEKVYICNGNNGTPDYRGRTPVGAVKNIPGPSLDAAVDPSSSINSSASVNYGVGEKFGENFHKQTIAEMAAHSHPITDPGHSHSYEGVVSDGRGADSTKTATKSTKQTGASVTNISVQASGQGQAFNVRQPSIAAVFIMYIP